MFSPFNTLKCFTAGSQVSVCDRLQIDFSAPALKPAKATHSWHSRTSVDRSSNIPSLFTALLAILD